MLFKVISAFWDGLTTPSIRSLHLEEKEQRESLSEKNIDKIISDSFPASDPPATY